MTTAARLTDEVIDGLSGRELDAHICLATGWIHNKYWYPSVAKTEAYTQPYKYSTNLGAAIKLLLGREWQMTSNSEQQVYLTITYGRAVCVSAKGHESEMATVTLPGLPQAAK